VITREEARLTAELEIRERDLSSGIADVLSFDELTGRKPLIYGGPDLRRCWIAYAILPGQDLRPGIIVLVDRETGAVLYAGSAHDEG
jgi:hypothetical protein